MEFGILKLFMTQHVSHLGYTPITERKLTSCTGFKIVQILKERAILRAHHKYSQKSADEDNNWPPSTISDQCFFFLSRFSFTWITCVYTSSSLHNLIISNPSSMTNSIPSHSSSSASLHRSLLTSLA